MKKIFIALVLVTVSFSAPTFADGRGDVLVSTNLALIVGDGRKNFGVHFNRRGGFYDFRGQRFRNRANYIAAVQRFEKQKAFAASFGSQRQFVNKGFVSQRRSFNNFNSRRSFNNGRYCK